MAYIYESVVPWGRSFDEYVRMFSLSDTDLDGQILGCADGPAAFNAGMTERGHRIVSCDPLYQFSTAQIRTRITEHQRAVEAMCSVAAEVRIFPLLTYDGELSPYVEPVVTAMKGSGRRVSIDHVAYEFQKGGNEMLRIVSGNQLPLKKTTETSAR